MRYRDIGHTGKKAGIVGLGLENIDGAPFERVKAVIHAALDAGVNYMDCFMPGQAVRENVAKALGARRKDVYIQGHIGSTDINQQYDISRDLPTVKRYFEDMLRIFGHIDFGMLFFLDSMEDYSAVFDGGIADYAVKLKQAGDIQHIGFSSHNPIIAKRVVRTGIVEVMMFSINLAFDLCPSDADVLDIMAGDGLGGAIGALDDERLALYTLCESMGVGISVMKTLGAGKLISKEHTPFSTPMTVGQCMHYALSRPAVFSALLGCRSPEEVRGAMGYLEADAGETDYTPFLNALEHGFQGSCVYCNHCQPCPSGIDIAAVNRYLDIAKLDKDNIPPSVRAHYSALNKNGADCVGCKSCEARCPFKVPIVERMSEAKDTFFRG